MYQSAEGASSVDVVLKDQTVWLSQKQLSELFVQKEVLSPNTSARYLLPVSYRRIQYVQKYAHIASDGNVYHTKFHNLDMIISVVYLVRLSPEKDTDKPLYTCS